MNPAVIAFVAALIITALVAFPLGKCLRDRPVIFYLAALVATGVFVGTYFAGVKFLPMRWYTVMFQKAYLATMFLLLVMYIGVLPQGSELWKKLVPIRGELSIMSFILYFGHIFMYLPMYWPRLGYLLTSGSTIATSLIVALVLTAVFAVLGVTSFRTIRNAMNYNVWKAIQRGAYVMMVLMMVHIGFVLAKSAFANPTSLAMISLAAYAVVIGLYAILRIRKALVDRAAE